MSDTNQADENRPPPGMPDFQAPTGAGWGSLESPPEVPHTSEPRQPGQDAFAAPGDIMGGRNDSPYLNGYRYEHPDEASSVNDLYQPDPGFQTGAVTQPVHQAGGYVDQGSWQSPAPSWQPPPTPPQNPPPVRRRVPPNEGSRRAPAGENVGRGLLLASIGILAGVGFMILMVTLDFFTVITSWLMAMLTIWLYGKGAGRPAAKGAMPLLGMLGGGTLLLFFVAVGTELWRFGSGFSPTERLAFTIELMFDPDILSGYAGLGIMLLIFGLLGALPLLRGLGKRS